MKVCQHRPLPDNRLNQLSNEQRGVPRRSLPPSLPPSVRRPCDAPKWILSGVGTERGPDPVQVPSKVLI